MHLNILSEAQRAQLGTLALFKREYTLVGGTAIALHIGHRRSIDFDLFKPTPINKNRIKQKLADTKNHYQLLFENFDGLHLMMDGVKWTFFMYPFAIGESLHKTDMFKMPDLLTLAAMKAYALGRRAKWKDYVDMHTILTQKHTLAEISARAKGIFGDAFAEKLLRVQLSYFNDIDYTEQVEWLIPPIAPEQIKEELTEIALSF